MIRRIGPMERILPPRGSMRASRTSTCRCTFTGTPNPGNPDCLHRSLRIGEPAAQLDGGRLCVWSALHLQMTFLVAWREEEEFRCCGEVRA